MSPQLWRSWAGEVAADVHAFALAGWAPVFALSTVVDGTTAEVFRIRYGDPHPFGWIRVMFNVALCRSWYGAGPWDDVASAWRQRHPMARPPTPRRGRSRGSASTRSPTWSTCAPAGRCGPSAALRCRP